MMTLQNIVEAVTSYNKTSDNDKYHTIKFLLDSIEDRQVLLKTGRLIKEEAEFEKLRNIVNSIK